MPYKEKEIQKIYFTISEVVTLSAKRFEKPLSQSAIRYWDDWFKINGIKRADNESRMFTKNAIRELFAIVYLIRVEGFTLEGAKRKLTMWKENEYSIPEQYLNVD